jgi:hypothetical protein
MVENGMSRVLLLANRKESAIWFFIAQKLLFANQYVRKFHKISKFSKNFKIFKKFQNKKIYKNSSKLSLKI